MDQNGKKEAFMAREFIIPGQIISGAGALDMAKNEISRQGKKALIVTDQVMIQLGNAKKLEEILEEQGVAYSVYAEITGEPTDKMIKAGLEQYRNQDCDFLIALGGGSPIDSMKAIASLINTDCGISDYMGKTIDCKMPPMTAIPTTAGTGSEATQFTIITDTEKDIKMLLKGKVLMPDLAVIDPQFTMTAPPAITAATGLDALCHCVEAYTSRKAQPLSDTFALSAVKRIFTYLPRAYHNGQDQEARIQMSLAALEAGIAFNNSSVTIIHGMSRPIGALFHIPHGMSNAMLLDECLKEVVSGAYERFGTLGREIGAAGINDTDEIASQKFVARIGELVRELEIPTLEEYGVSRKEFFSVIDKMSTDAMDSGSPQNTMKEIDIEDVKEIYRRLW